MSQSLNALHAVRQFVEKHSALRTSVYSQPVELLWIIKRRNIKLDYIAADLAALWYSHHDRGGAVAGFALSQRGLLQTEDADTAKTEICQRASSELLTS